MENLKLCDSDYRFMLIVWTNAPIGSGRLVELCYEKLGWKKSTTYTTIKKLSEKGYIINDNATVSVLISKEEVQSVETDYFVDRTFEGSLPQFLTAFLGGKKISDKEAEEIIRMIDSHKEKSASLNGEKENSSCNKMDENSPLKSGEENSSLKGRDK